MAKITKTSSKRTGSKKIIKKCEKTSTKKTCERTGRKKIAKLLSLMGFQDDDHDTTVKIMFARLRQIQERTKAATAHENRSMVKRIIFKFGGKKVHLNPTTKVHVETSEIVTSGDDDDMEIDSSNISFEDRSGHKINHVDQSFEEKRFENMANNNMEATHHATGLRSENPNSGMDVTEFITSIGGSEAVLVIEKTLTKSDCDKNQGRLLIPMLQVKNRGFLGTDEERRLGILRESISVEVFDPERRKLTLNLAQWKMKNENYVLKTNWKKLVVMNGLKENVVIRVFAFRVDQKLCFAVVRV